MGAPKPVEVSPLAVAADMTAFLEFECWREPCAGILGYGKFCCRYGRFRVREKKNCAQRAPRQRFSSNGVGCLAGRV
jgi:hypothetical protein